MPSHLLNGWISPCVDNVIVFVLRFIRELAGPLPLRDLRPEIIFTPFDEFSAVARDVHPAAGAVGIE